MTELNFEEIKKQAAQEIYEEKFRAAVEQEKERIKKRKNIFDILFPYSIIFVKKS